MKLGLALGGGALRGVAHIGVLQILQERGIVPDLIVGTSIGAMVGGIYACGVNPRMLESIVLQINMRDLYDVSFPTEGMIKGDRVLTMLRTLTGNRDMSETAIPFAAIAADIESGDMVVLDHGKVCDAIRASISIPGIFVPCIMNGRKLCDGAMVDRVPIKTAKSLGADIVIGVDVGYKKGYVTKAEGMITYLLRCFDIMDWELTEYRVTEADVVISPDLKGIDYTSLRDAEEAIERGRVACEESLEEILAVMENKQIALAKKPRARKPKLSVEEE